MIGLVILGLFFVLFSLEKSSPGTIPAIVLVIGFLVFVHYWSMGYLPPIIIQR